MKKRKLSELINRYGITNKERETLNLLPFLSMTDKISSNYQTGIYSIQQLEQYNLCLVGAKSLLENNIPVFWIRGEVSGLRTYSHLYFDLKDEKSLVQGIIRKLTNNSSRAYNLIDFDWKKITQKVYQIYQSLR